MISLLIPVYNEQGAIEDTIRQAHRALEHTGEEFEICAIDDGSTDQTPHILQKINLPHLCVITHRKNQGYGNTMRTGIRRSRGELIATIDADGTYPAEAFGEMLQVMRTTQADMVVGARTKKGVQIPLIRKPAKAVVALLANTLTGIKIPDNNSGMRIFTRQLGEQFMHLYPQRFSFTITITLAALTSGYMVEFFPIDYFKRIGNSSLSSGCNGVKNFISFLGLIIRITTYFRPLRFFLWPGAILILTGIGTVGYTLSQEANISDAGMLMLLMGLQIGLFGLLAEVIVRHGQRHTQ